MNYTIENIKNAKNTVELADMVDSVLSSIGDFDQSMGWGEIADEYEKNAESMAEVNTANWIRQAEVRWFELEG